MIMSRRRGADNSIGMSSLYAEYYNFVYLIEYFQPNSNTLI
jgi:hypothetical protein